MQPLDRLEVLSWSRNSIRCTRFWSNHHLNLYLLRDLNIRHLSLGLAGLVRVDHHSQIDMYHCELPRADESFFQSSQRLGCPFKVTGKFQRDVFGKFFRDYGVSIAMQFVTLHMKLSSRFYVDDRVMTLNRLSCHQVVARLVRRSLLLGSLSWPMPCAQNGTVCEYRASMTAILKVH
ncbi:hypothetical protein BDV35DRAFT_365769 [Aspergillus flavus]|uniref:Uncharacterized protein n=1 Tax=Aspergillus flavus TaxID=5059 RepID=A0A5N6GN94_ASPFL|nr:hypothetical protein BDV35DRAFT_365769 [Aspergillus flavus]